MNEAYMESRIRRMKAGYKYAQGMPAQISEDRVVEFFKTNDQFDYTVADISKGLGYKYNSIKYHIQLMADSGELVRVREMGNGWTYQLPNWLDQKKQAEVKRLLQQKQ